MEAAHDQSTTAPPAGGPADGPTDITNVAKGKRTKRQRPQSPIRFTFSPSNNNDLTSSPLSSSGFRADSITTEDEDTAESLILLSRGQSIDMKKNKDDYDGAFKFNSKKYIQSTATGAGGVFVYECKTCSRTFPSFQALGGHRASHKKPRNNDDMPKPPPFMDKKEPPAPEILSRNDYYYSSSSSLSIQLNNRGSLIGNTMKSSSRLHGCSICGTDFNSGQALGGHMRRHRVAGGRNKGGNGSGVTTNPTVLSLVPYSPVTTVEVCDRKLDKDDALCLGLDLNLPAPRETTVAGGNDDQRQKRSGGFSPAGENDKKQPPAVHLSTATTMTDCHY